MKLNYKIGECPACHKTIQAEAEVKVEAKIELPRRLLIAYPRLDADDVNISSQVIFTGVVITHECSDSPEPGPYKDYENCRDQPST